MFAPADEDEEGAAAGAILDSFSVFKWTVPSECYVSQQTHLNITLHFFRHRFACQRMRKLSVLCVRRLGAAKAQLFQGQQTLVVLVMLPLKQLLRVLEQLALSEQRQAVAFL